MQWYDNEVDVDSHSDYWIFQTVYWEGYKLQRYVIVTMKFTKNDKENITYVLRS